MATAVVIAIERHPCVEDALVERDEPIHVGCEERQVVQVVDQSHARAASL
jgi:hypothetical protein